MNQDKIARWPLLGGLAAGLAASLCCVGPLALVMLGLGGAWMANLTALEAYRPFFLGVGAAFLFLAYRKIFRAPICTSGSACATPHSARIHKLLFWIVAALILLAIVFPYFAPLLY